MPSTTHTAQYHYLICTARIDNIVEGTCGKRSPGKWHDGELLEKEMEQRGWTRGKGWTCPECSTPAAAVESEKPKRQSRGKAEVPAQPEPEWGSQ